MTEFSRRQFLNKSSMAAAASVVAASTSRISRGESGPNERIQLGLIGCGGIMRNHVGTLAKHKETINIQAICDVDTAQMDHIDSMLKESQSTPPQRTGDYQEILANPEIDAVIIATPHHWHCPMTLRAIAAKKDVYCEKPMSHVFNEGRLVAEAARNSDQIVHHGSQMRSSPVTLQAGELLKQGVIGDVKIAKAWNVQERGTKAIVPDSDPPQTVDYDRWLGPAPKRPFNRNRLHSNWRVYQDYGNGDIGDDGIHDIDMARWGLGVETHPSRITAHGSDVFYKGDQKGDREFPDNMMVAWNYDDGRVMLYEDRLYAPYGLHGFDSGNAFYGTEGYMIFSRRGYYQVYLGPKEKLGPGVPKEIRGQRGYVEHMANFLEALRTRESTNADPDVAHYSCALVHLGEVAFRTQSVLEFDAAAEKITNNSDAQQMLSKTYRAPYGLPTS